MTKNPGTQKGKCRNTGKNGCHAPHNPGRCCNSWLNSTLRSTCICQLEKRRGEGELCRRRLRPALRSVASLKRHPSTQRSRVAAAAAARCRLFKVKKRPLPQRASSAQARSRRAGSTGCSSSRASARRRDYQIVEPWFSGPQKIPTRAPSSTQVWLRSGRTRASDAISDHTCRRRGPGPSPTAGRTVDNPGFFRQALKAGATRTSRG